MKTKAGGHSALLLAAGLLVGGATAAPVTRAALAAAPVSDSASTASAASASARAKAAAAHHVKSVTHPKSIKAAPKPVLASRKPATVPGSDVPTSDGDGSAAQIPSTVANANAQLTNTLAARPEATDPAPAGAESVSIAPDKLGELDRLLQQGAPPESLASVTVEADPDAAMALSSADPASTDHAALIGEIFIGIGLLLTAASAARMLMA